MNLQSIINDINKRMSAYTDSRQPTDDEVTITWLLTEIKRLEEAMCPRCAAEAAVTSLKETHNKASRAAYDKTYCQGHADNVILCGDDCATCTKFNKEDE